MLQTMPDRPGQSDPVRSNNAEASKADIVPPFMGTKHKHSGEDAELASCTDAAA